MCVTPALSMVAHKRLVYQLIFAQDNPKTGSLHISDPLGTDSPFVLFRRHNSRPLASYRSAHELPSHSGFRFPSIIKPKNHQQGQDKYKPLTAGSQLALIFTSATSRFHPSHVRDGLSQRSVCVLDMIDSASNFLVFPPAADHPLGLTSPHCPP